MISRNIRCLLAGTAVWSACLSEPALAAPAAAPSLEVLQAKADRHLKRFGGGDLSQVCDGGPDLAALAERRVNPGIKGLSDLFLGICALQRRQSAEALTALGRVEAAISATPLLSDLEPLVDRFGMFAAADAKAWPELATYTVHIALRDRPNEFAELDEKLLFFTLRSLPQEDAERVISAFGSAASYTSLSIDLQQSFAFRAVGPALKTGDTAFAEKMAAKVTSPSNIRRMLIDRRYERIWSLLADRAGPNMAKVRDAAADERAAAFRARPADLQVGADAMLAANYAGRFAQAEVLAGELKLAQGKLDKYDEPEAWAINYYVSALDHLGRSTEADQWFDRLVALPMEGREWMVNFAINRAERLVAAGRWEDAFGAATYAVTVADKQGSPYARQVAEADRACAAWQFGQKQELGTAWPRLKQNWKDNVGATIALALCTDRSAEAIAILKQGLADEDKRADTLEAMQGSRGDFLGDTVYPVGTVDSLLASDTELREALNRHGRLLPDELVPVRPAP